MRRSWFGDAKKVIVVIGGEAQLQSMEAKTVDLFPQCQLRSESQTKVGAINNTYLGSITLCVAEFSHETPCTKAAL